MKYRAALFDLDGTLLDTESLSDKAIYQVYKEYLSDELKDEFQERNDRLPWELKQLILGLRGSEWAPIVIEYAIQKWNVTEPQVLDPSYLWNAWETNLNAMCHQVEACPGALDIVLALKQKGIPMAIATSSRSVAVAKKRTNHNSIFQHMDAIVSGDHPAVEKGKPAPDIYYEAARQLGVDPKDCIVFEDALSGMRAGRAAGSFVVGVPDPRFTYEERKRFEVEADLIVKSLEELDIQALL